MSKMTVELATKPHRKKVMAALGAINMVCFLGIAIVIIVYVLFSILNIDNPPQDSQLLLNVTWMLVVSTPLFFVVSLAGTWINFGFGNYGMSFVFALAPLVNILGAPLFLQLSGAV